MTWTDLRAQPTEIPEGHQLCIDVLVGLSQEPKSLPSRLFYDDEGSRLFQQITRLDEYYLPRVELQIFREHGRALLGSVAGQALNVVDLGCGDGHKSAVLIAHLRALGADVRYVPIDISEQALRSASETVIAQFPDIEIAGVRGDYFDSIRWLGKQSSRRKIVLFLGSNIGNFDKAHARGMLRQLRMSLAPDDLALLGFDLKKDIDTLLAAYNDREGVTAAFNLNLLRRINRELGADFDLDKWRHYGTYNALTGAMESYLVSLEAQTVHIQALEEAFHFVAWEPIHTEYSYKYLDSDIVELAGFSGFEILASQKDSKGWFSTALWVVSKTGGTTEGWTQ